ncbi:membrane protein [Burkholderia phage BcepF1]|uniref:Membrane protein n=1 Tax=Burkholderia phage BcepF1 TaxID=2886897 RepID=A1YZS3_9CAUD|nr:membrane protein [Burkholderia phage BcepF1]ABL96750.1 membrane protein [Burkholderia phage BcepF1]
MRSTMRANANGHRLRKTTICCRSSGAVCDRVMAFRKRSSAGTSTRFRLTSGFLASISRTRTNLSCLLACAGSIASSTSTNRGTTNDHHHRLFDARLHHGRNPRRDRHHLVGSSGGHVMNTWLVAGAFLAFYVWVVMPILSYFFGKSDES